MEQPYTFRQGTSRAPRTLGQKLKSSRYVVVFETTLLYLILSLQVAEAQSTTLESRGLQLVQSICPAIVDIYPAEEWQRCKDRLERPRFHVAVGVEKSTSLLVVGLPTALCRDENSVAVMRTTDGGDSWSLAGTAEGAFGEAFFLRPDFGWILTHWASAASYPTLYRVEKGTMTRIEDAKSGIEKPVECPFTYAWNLVFQNEKEGMVQVACFKGLGIELPWMSGVRIMRTLDGGRTWSIWAEKELPGWYHLMEAKEGVTATTTTRFWNSWHVDNELDRPTIYYQDGMEPAKAILEMPWPAENPCLDVSSKKDSGQNALPSGGADDFVSFSLVADEL